LTGKLIASRLTSDVNRLLLVFGGGIDSMQREDPCLEVLLDLNGMTYYYDSGHWIKYEVRKVSP
jgi:hypothetical protein